MQVYHEEEDDNEVGNSLVGDILSNWRLIVGGLVLALAAYILGPLLGPLAELFKMAFGAAVGTVAFLAQTPWLIPLLGGLGLAASAVLRRWQTARDKSAQQVHTQNDVACQNSIRKLAEHVQLGKDNLVGPRTDAERKQGVAVAAYGSTAIEVSDLGALSPDTAERLVRDALRVHQRQTAPRAGAGLPAGGIAAHVEHEPR